MVTFVFLRNGQNITVSLLSMRHQVHEEEPLSSFTLFHDNPVSVNTHCDPAMKATLEFHF